MKKKKRLIFKIIPFVFCIFASLLVIAISHLISTIHHPQNIKTEEVQEARYVISSAKIETFSYRRNTAVNQAARTYVKMFCITYIDGRGRQVNKNERLDDAIKNIKISNISEYVVYKTYATRYSDDVTYRRKEESWKQRCEYHITQEIYDSVFLEEQEIMEEY